jgi:hypothetical protein
MAKVLILDQSKSMRNTLRERLEYEGFSTEAAEDEEAASNMCEKIPFDVILSDTGCKIPDKGVPFIVLSSEASIDSAVEAVRNGAQDYLTKPIDMNRLLQSIHRTIDDPAPVPAPPAGPAPPPPPPRPPPPAAGTMRARSISSAPRPRSNMSAC